MQPYFYPYLGHFQLMKAVDVWVIFDSINYRPKSWINRNRIIHPNEIPGWQFMSIPIKNSTRSYQINEVEVSNLPEWKDRLTRKLLVYKSIAPSFDTTLEIFKSGLSPTSNYLSNFLVGALKNVIELLDISVEIVLASDLEDFPQSAAHPGEWALKIASMLGASSYLNPISGSNIFRAEEFKSAGISLEFFNPKLFEYAQGDRKFLPGLSILDVLMFNEPKVIKKWLQFGEIIKAS